MKFITRRIGNISATLILVLLISLVTNSHAEQIYDVPGTYKASEVLPADFINNKYYTIREEVTWFDGLNLFTVDTEMGSFEIWGEPMLRVRLKEFVAWNELDEISTVEAGAKAIGKAALSPVTALLKAFSHPILTIKGVPQGISRMFKSIGRDVVDVAEVLSGKDDDYSPGSLDRHEDDDASIITRSTEILVGVNKSYRKLAEDAGVNPYTTNAVMREELERLAKVDAYLSKSTKLLSPNFTGALGVVEKVSKKVYKDSWYEVVEQNKKSLDTLGVSEEKGQQFLDHDFINLSLVTVMIEALNELEGVDDRSVVIDQALLLDTESEAIWFAECLLMAQWFHQNEAPIAKMLPDTLVPVALTKDQRVIVFTAADSALWTEEAAKVSTEFTQNYEKYSDQREAWVADKASPRFVAGLEKLGWSVRSGLRSTTLPEIPWGLQDD